MPWPLYLAFKQLFPTGRRFPFFTAISILGVALGVMLIVVCMGVMGGFGFQIRRMIVDTQGEIQIVGRELVDDPAAVMAAVSRVRGVTGITPIDEGFTMVEFDRRIEFPLIQGVDLAHVESVMPLHKFILGGSLDDLDDDSVILNQKLADSLHVGVGDTLRIYSPLMLTSKGDEVVLPRTLRVAGLFEIGHQQLDSETVLVTLRVMQDLYGHGHKVQGFNVKLAPGEDIDAAVPRVRDALPPSIAFTVRSWEESFADFLWILALEKNMLLLLLLCVELVAAFMVMSLLLVLVIKKTREIGLLSALGGQPRQVALCFAAQGLFTGLVGTALGLGFGFLILDFRNELVRGITALIGGRDALVKFYQFQQLPEHLEHRDLVVTILASLFLSTLAGLIPAWRAGRMNPVEALRGE